MFSMETLETRMLEQLLITKQSEQQTLVDLQSNLLEQLTKHQVLQDMEQ